MPGFLKAAAIVVSGGAIVSTGALKVIPEDVIASSLLFATAPVPEFARAPCKEQLWLNADRGCQTWTVARGAVRRVLFAEPPTGAPDLRLATVEATATTPTHTPYATDKANNKAKSARSVRDSTASHASATPPRAADVRRAITSRAAMESSL